MPNVFSHFYQLDEAISNFRVVGWHFSFVFKELRALRGFLGPPYEAKKIVLFHHFLLISLLEQ